MALKVMEVESSSFAEKIGIKADDYIMKINGNHIYDFLDLNYFSAEVDLDVEFMHNKKIKTVSAMKDVESSFGILTEEHKCRECANNCIFCFVDQMPPGMRKTLYIKDDDYAFSFIYGNYITLTNLSEEVIDKIIKMKISPLYVSVHATNPELRKSMMGYAHDSDILARLKKLAKGGIEYHAQLVLIPGYNDGEELGRSLRELTSPELNTIGIGVVPVGVTKFRGNLKKLPLFDKAGANVVVETVNRFRKDFPQIYPSDEFIIKAGVDIPTTEYYGSFDEIENGIGMVRTFMDNWAYDKEVFAEYILSEVKQDLLFVTGVSAQNLIKSSVKELNELIKPYKAEVKVVINYLMGETVTVCGLLTVEDVEAQVTLKENQIPVLSGDFFNSEGVTLDNFDKQDIAGKFNRNIVVVNPLFESWELIKQKDSNEI